MPIGMITGLGNFVLNLFSKFAKLLIEKPLYFIPLILILLFFPLDLFDMILYILINFFILLLNGIIIGILIFIYAVIYIVMYPITWLSDKLKDFGDAIDDLPGIPDIDFPVLSVPWTLSYSTWMISYVNFNMFSTGGSVITENCLFEYILGLMSLTAPIW